MKRLRVQGAALAVVVAVGVIGICGAGLWGGVFAGFRLQASDALFPVGAGEPRVVVVGVDEASLTQVGVRWPWPRATQAQLVAAIGAAKPTAVVLDIVYQPAADGDAALADALASTHAVIASAPKLARSSIDRLYATTSLVAPVPAIADAADVVGHGAITPDVFDGVVRALPLVVDGPRQDFIPSLSLAAIAEVDRVSPIVTVRPHGVQLGNRFIPTDRRGRLRVAYPNDPDGARLISAGDVLAGRVPTSRLHNKVVVVGVMDPTLGDYHATPSDKGAGAAGVVIQAAAIDTMLSHRYLSVTGNGQTMVWLALLALVVALATSRLRPWLAALAATAGLIGYFFVAFVRFDRGTEMDLVWPPVGVGLAFVGTLAVRVIVDARERRRMAHLLEQFVPAPIASRLLNQGRGRADIGSGMITFLFTDVVGSTVAWEHYPQKMGQAMRRHDELVEAAVEGSGGALVRPRGEGDSRFAVFLDPAQCAKAALAVDRAMRAEKWDTPEPVEVRMGIHTGEAEFRDADYYGSAVNRCARIRGVAGAGEIMMSSVTADLIMTEMPAGALEDFGFHALKGMEEPEHVFALRPGVRT